MKSYIKGLVTGLLIGAAVTAIPAVAENIDALFNEVRININGIDRVQWGESITLADGTQTPYSILYNGTTYLPLRKTAELLGKEVYWNGDSKTVSVVDKGDKTTVAEKPDKNGNVWTYYTFIDKDNNTYLGARDEVRGYERVYNIGRNTVKVTDTSIYFVSEGGYQTAYIVKLDFENDENTQDGEILTEITHAVDGERVMFAGDYVYCIGMKLGPGAQGRERLTAYNIVTGTSAQINLTKDNHLRVEDLRILEETDETVRLAYDVSYFGDNIGYCEVVLDKTANEFNMSVETLNIPQG